MKKNLKRIPLPRRAGHRLGEEGVTLVELMLTAAAFSLFMASVASFWVSYTRCVTYLNDRLDVGNEAMVSRSLLTRDLSVAQSVFQGPNQGWTLNLNSGPNPQVSYWLQGDQLMMGPGGATVAHHLSAAQFYGGGPWAASAFLTFLKGSQTASLEVDWEPITP